MAGPVLVITVFEVPTDDTDEFLVAWESAQDYRQQCPGHLDTALHRAVTESACFRFVEIGHWRSEQEYSEAVSRKEFRSAASGLRWTSHGGLYGTVRPAHPGWPATVARHLARNEGFGAAVRSSIEELADWAKVEQPGLARLMSELAKDRPDLGRVRVGRPDLAHLTWDWAKVADLARLAPDGNVVIMFCDIEGSTAMNEEMGDREWVRLIERYERLIRRAVSAHSGHVVKSQGDGFMVAFARPAEAVRCGIAVQHGQSSALTGPHGAPVRVRIGIHMGRSVRHGEDLLGRNVAMAARVATEARGGEILLSESVHDAVRDVFPVGAVRDVELKGFSGTHRVYPVETTA